MTELREQIARGRGRERHGSGRATLVDLVVIEKRQHVGPVGETAAGLVFLERRRGLVAPAALGRKAVPNQEVDLVEPAAVLLAPGENLLVRAAGQDARLEGVILD